MIEKPYIGHHGEGMNLKIHDCYFCGGPAKMTVSFTFVSCIKEGCRVNGPDRKSETEAIEAWNSLASRLKPQPKVVTIKRWVNVYEQDGVTFTGGSYDSKKHALDDLRNSGYIDTVEVEITFTDSRGCE